MPKPNTANENGHHQGFISQEPFYCIVLVIWVIAALWPPGRRAAREEAQGGRAQGDGRRRRRLPRRARDRRRGSQARRVAGRQEVGRRVYASIRMSMFPDACRAVGIAVESDEEKSRHFASRL